MNSTLQPSIRLAERASVCAAALYYLNAGISVLPCKGKAPAIKWEHLTTRRANARTVEAWDAVGLLENVGIIGGAVSNGLCIIDLDGLDAVSAFQQQFPALLDTYTVTSGSGNGQHVYLYARTIPPTTRVTGCAVGNVELRAHGAYVVAPPSIHPVTNQPYTVAHEAGIARVDDLNGVVEWIKELMREKHGGDLPAARGTHRPTVVVDVEPWAAAALAGECEAVAREQTGRNDRLFIAALKMGSMIASGFLNRVDVENDLFQAARHLSADDGEAATWRTIASGIRTGMKNKRVKQVKEK